jgi:serine/threonine-protein kinase
MPIDPRMLVIGDQIPGEKWVVCRRLGAGGMGVVFEVVRPPGIRGAMKIMYPHLATKREFVESYLNEVRVTAALSHPNIVRVTYFDELPDGTLYYVMELLHGSTLRDTMVAHGRPLTPYMVFEIIKQIGQGLTLAHDAGVVHRDLKPENAFLHAPNKDERVVKVCDFGIAALYRDKTRSRGVNGTPKYMAPEQYLDQRVSPRTDIYALGLMTYEMLTGRFPFEQPLPKDVDVLRDLHLKGRRIAPSHYLPTIPREVDILLLTSMAPNPADRPASVDEFVNRLEALAGLPGFAASADINSTDPTFETLAGLANRLSEESATKDEGQLPQGNEVGVSGDPTVEGISQPPVDGRSLEEVVLTTNPPVAFAAAPATGSVAHVATPTVPSGNSGGERVWAVVPVPAVPSPQPMGSAPQPLTPPQPMPRRVPMTARYGTPFLQPQPYPPPRSMQLGQATTSRPVLSERTRDDAVVTISRRAMRRVLIVAPILALATIILVLAAARRVDDKSAGRSSAPESPGPSITTVATTGLTVQTVPVQTPTPSSAEVAGTSAVPLGAPSSPSSTAPAPSAVPPVATAAASVTSGATARSVPGKPPKRAAAPPSRTVSEEAWGWDPWDPSPSRPPTQTPRDDGRDLLPKSP